jgi:hypothetical protein
MILVLEGITQRVGAEAQLYDINLTLEPGSLNLLLGPDPRRQDFSHALDGWPRPAE